MWNGMNKGTFGFFLFYTLEYVTMIIINHGVHGLQIDDLTTNELHDI